MVFRGWRRVMVMMTAVLIFVSDEIKIAVKNKVFPQLKGTPKTAAGPGEIKKDWKIKKALNCEIIHWGSFFAGRDKRNIR